MVVTDNTCVKLTIKRYLKSLTHGSPLTKVGKKSWIIDEFLLHCANLFKDDNYSFVIPKHGIF